MASFMSLQFVLLLSVTNFIILRPIGTYAKSKNSGKKPHKLLFVFGDSAFDPGNNQYIEGIENSGPAYSWPYGQHFFAGPTGRHSNGRIVPDFIAQKANLSLIPSCLEPAANFTDGANFASAGAGIFSDNSKVMNLEQQMRKFDEVRERLEKKVGDKTARKTLKGAVYIFSFGSKEYLSLYLSGQNTSKSEQKQFSEMVVGNLSNTFLEIYNAGGRKFAFQNVGPLGCFPALRANRGPCVEELMSMAKRHNKALGSELKRLGNHLPGFKYSLFDYYGSLEDRINNASKYGFEEAKEACYKNTEAINGAVNNWGGNNLMDQYTLCHDSARYVFFDGLHTTEETNSQLAELMWDGPASITQPWTLKQFFEL